MNNTPPAKDRLSAAMRVALAGLAFVFFAGNALPSQTDASQAAEVNMIALYKASMAEGDRTRALQQVLHYSEQAYGENDPMTIKLMHRYGYALYEDGQYREAIEVLKETLARSTRVHGETGGEAFEINMNLGKAYSQYRQRWAPRLQYFDRALEILRKRGERESIAYVATLVHIVIDLLNSSSLSGSYTADLGDALEPEEVSDLEVSTGGEYRGNFDKPRQYLLEAEDISARLGNVDEYISAKIAVLHARLRVLETADLAAVPGGVGGRITRSAARGDYDREEERLAVAIDKLSQDAEMNRSFLNAANKLLLEIAWLDKDAERLTNLCASGALDSASEYPREQLYEIMEGGVVFAPDVGIRVSTNIFKQSKFSNRPQLDENGKPVKKPYFKPVCVDGRLMAALVHAPRVTIEELRPPE